jgi:predicted RND superfamily exporter protein
MHWHRRIQQTTGVELKTFYQRWVVGRPAVLLFLMALLAGLALLQLPKLRLDASSDSLLLQGDPDLERWREVSETYDSNEFLILTWEPPGPLLGEQSLSGLSDMVAVLEDIPGVLSVTSVLDVPLLESPPLGLTDLANADAMPTLRDPKVDRSLALEELTTSPLYRNLLVSETGDLTAVQVMLEADEEAEVLLAEREALRRQRETGVLDATQSQRLMTVSAEYDVASARVSEQRDRLVADVRDVAEQFRHQANIFVGGVPMIAADMIAFVRADLVTFGSAIVLVMSLVLWLIFRDWRWVLAPVASCTITALLMLGLLAALDWRMTVISSNFVAVLLIITLSLSIHLVVRYRELEHTQPDLTRNERALAAAKLMLVPCLYTALTTMVAFTSLVVAGIQPVIDFGWMMTTGIVVGFLVSFTLVPALMALLPPGAPVLPASQDVSFTRHLSRIVEQRGGLVIGVSLLLAIATAVGVSRLQVENRFIDYFKESTEIYQGMELLDAKLGGTIPLDIVILPPSDGDDSSDAPVSTAASESIAETSQAEDAFSDTAFGGDAFLDDDPFANDIAFSDEQSAAPSYWFGLAGRRLIDDVHAIVDARPESGKVLSLSTTFEVVDGLYGDTLGSIEMALIQNSLPADVSSVLIEPYFDPESDQTRITVRAMETSESLRRDAFLKQLRAEILEATGIEEERLQFTGLLVLYNNVLQSLFSSQIMTLGAVFIAIGLMFWVLFRSLSLALLALAPNLLAAGLVLGMMGLAGIPLDIMTITIAAIVVGIGVDDCIHYIHRFRDEFAEDRDYHAAMHRSHGSIGRAMFYTTVTIVVGFSMLTLSNFTPSLYFGVLTVVAMVAAVAGALLLLPKLILITRPLGAEA